MDDSPPAPLSEQSRRRTLSRRGVIAGLALAPLAVEVGRASSALASGGGQAALPAGLASNLAQGPGRIVHNTNPPLEESVLSALEGFITPIPLHFIRNHSATPEIDVDTWRLSVGGEVDRPLEFSYADLRSLASRSLNVLIECAGNSRSRYSPQATGTAWKDGAVSVAEWTGVPLRTVLELAGLRSSTVHVIARGADPARVTRGLPTDQALRPEVLLAWAMNGETLPAAHGFPVRLVVPNWIGVANVKWVEQITASPVPHEGAQQGVNYVYDRPGKPVEPATLLPVKSVIARPEAGATVGGATMLSGFAWSGGGQVVQVEVSADGGQTWAPAHLLEPNTSPLTWVRWHYAWSPPAAGNYFLMSRATDATGAQQPPSVEWNRLGYSYNAWVPVPVSVGAAAAAPPPAPEPAPPADPAAVPPAADPAAAGHPGAGVFAANCARCHGDAGQGAPNGPRLVGEVTAVRQVSKDDLFTYVKATMPLDNPGSLTDAQYHAVVEFLRQANGLP